MVWLTCVVAAVVVAASGATSARAATAGRAMFGDPRDHRSAGQRALSKEEVATVKREYKRGVDAYGRNDAQTAVDAFRTVVRLAPALPDAHLNLGVSLERLQRYDDAHAAYANGVDLLPRSVTLLTALCTLENLRRAPPPQSTRELCRRAVRLAPDDPRTHHNVAVAAINAFEFDEGLKHMRRAAELDPSSSVYAAGIITALSRAGGCEEMRSAKWDGIGVSVHNEESRVIRSRATADSICNINDTRAYGLYDHGNERHLAELAVHQTLKNVPPCQNRFSLIKRYRATNVYAGLDEPVKVLRYENVCMEGDSGVVYSERRCEIYYNDHLATQKVAEHFSGLGAAQRTIHVTRPAMSVMQQRLVNYYHWVVEAAAKLAYLKNHVFPKLRKSAGGDSEMMPVYVLPDLDMARETVKLFQLNEDDILYYSTTDSVPPGADGPSSGKQRYLFDELYVIDWRNHAAASADVWNVHVPPPVAVRYIRTELRRAVLGGSGYEADDGGDTKLKVMFASREDAGARKMPNERDLVAAVRVAVAEFPNSSFDVYMGKGKTIEQQVRSYADADIVVGPHGAALTNMLYMRPGGGVVLLPMRPLVDQCYVRLPERLGLHQHIVDDYGAYYYANFPYADEAVVERTVAAVRAIARRVLDGRRAAGGAGGGAAKEEL